MCNTLKGHEGPLKRAAWRTAEGSSFVALLELTQRQIPITKDLRAEEKYIQKIGALVREKTRA